MTITATILYPYDSRVEELFSPEDRQISKRARYELRKDGDALAFAITASDSTSLRACMTTITKVLSAWEASAHHGTT